MVLIDHDADSNLCAAEERVGDMISEANATTLPDRIKVCVPRHLCCHVLVRPLGSCRSGLRPASLHCLAERLVSVQISGLGAACTLLHTLQVLAQVVAEQFGGSYDSEAALEHFWLAASAAEKRVKRWAR